MSEARREPDDKVMPVGASDPAPAEVDGPSCVQGDVERRGKDSTKGAADAQVLGICFRVVEDSPDLISVIDREYRYRIINPTYTRRHDRPANEILGHTVADLYGEKVFQTIRPNLDRCFAGEAVSYEAWFDYPVGGRRYMQVNYYPLYGDGRVGYVGLVARDKTESRLAEEERERLLEQLRTERARLETLLRSVPAGVLFAEAPSGRLVFANDEAERIFRQPTLYVADIQQYSRFAVFHPNGRHYEPEEFPLARSIQAGEVVSSEEMSFLRGDGTCGTLRMNTAPIRGPQGQIVGAVGAFYDVTEEKLAAEGLQRLAAIVESSDDAIVSETLEGVITSWNPSAERLYGYTVEESVGKPFAILMPPDRLDELTFVMEAIKCEARIERYETVHVGKDGRRIDVSVSVSPLKDASGTISGVATIARDVSERKKAEEELRSANQSLRMYARIVENSPDFISAIDREYHYRMVNPTYSRMTGVPTEEIIGQTAARITLDGFFEKLERPVLDRCFRGEIVHLETWVDIATSGRRYLELHYYPLFRDGEVEYAVVMARDATERKVAETQLERLLQEQVQARQRIEVLATSAERRAAELQAVLDNMVDAVFVFDAAGRLTLSNEAGLRLIGLTSVADLARPPAEIPSLLSVRRADGTPISPEDLVHVRALAGQIVVSEDQIVYNPQARRDVYLRISAAPIRDESGKIVGSVMVARDVTELRELERLKDQFIAVAAHELKTPVTIMKGYAQTLLRTPASYPPPAVRMLDAINRGADRIDRIVRDLLDISRLHAGTLELRPERIDLPELVQEVVDRMALVDPTHRIRIVSREPAVVQGDRDRLEQVLINLIDNAVRYSPGGGDVEVALAVHVGEAVVSVKDYGVGIPKEKQAHIFDRFYRAHTNTPYDYGGMGVGLYISKEIVSRHDGRMWFESQEGKGSTFSFSLPL